MFCRSQRNSCIHGSHTEEYSVVIHVIWHAGTKPTKFSSVEVSSGVEFRVVTLYMKLE